MEDQLHQQHHALLNSRNTTLTIPNPPSGGGCCGGHNNGGGAGDIDEGNVNNADFLNSLPPGYRFKPTEEELILQYLVKKVKDDPLPPNLIRVVDLYNHNPQCLAETTRPIGGEEWYFFTPRDKKYPNGSRPNRAAGDGYWKASGADKPIFSDGVKIGCRKVLVFYQGKFPKGDKTNWIMHEFRVESPPKIRHENCMRLDDWVLCRLYEKEEKEETERKDDKQNLVRPNKRQKPNLPMQEPSPHQPGQVSPQYNSYINQGASSSVPPFPLSINVVPYSPPIADQAALLRRNLQVPSHQNMNRMDNNVRLHRLSDYAPVGFNNLDPFQLSYDPHSFSSFDDGLSKCTFFPDQRGGK